ncbi:uncharacterized protein FIBRA_04405 [Fibroporia radiculosa]|uniref:Ras-GAP domain-containing protein n=1 Tax=Fibroporia radiculosa TaxID=599839 RepID=J4H2Y1_9APHY|nr:uncharacterized protein FIBRA_04405 [Fibroporia radiculosa]CCM02314.1 predicted protein [Fibroporia radiculosa]
MSAANIDFAASHHDFESIDAPEAQNDPSDILSGPALPLSIATQRMISRAKHSSMTSLNSAAASTTSFSTSSKYSAVYEKTTFVTSKTIASLNAVITKFAGRIVYHLSASNWNIVLDKIRVKIRSLSRATEDDPDIIDLQLMIYSALDRNRLVQSLQEVSSLLLHMKTDAQAAVAIPLRAAIWNWIDLFPDEFGDNIRYSRRMEGAPERVFDILFDSQEGSQKTVFWPTLTALVCISSERMKVDFQENSMGMSRGQHGRRDRQFFELIMRSLSSLTKYSEEALICALDVCRAAFRVHLEDGAEHPLHLLAHDIAHELKRLLWNWNNQKPFWECDEIDVALVADVLVTIYRYLPPEESLPLFGLCVDPERSPAVKITVAKACITLIEEMPVATTSGRSKVNTHASNFAHLSGNELDEQGNMKRPNARPKAKRYTAETLPDRELLAYSLMALFRVDPLWFLSTMDNAQIPEYVPIAVACWHAPLDLAIKMAMARTLRNMIDTVVKMSTAHTFYDACSNWAVHVTPATLATFCTNLLDARTDLQAQRVWINMAYEILYRYTQPANTEQTKKIHLAKERLPAFAIAEIAFLVSLTSADTSVTLTAAHCLRLLAQAETAPDAPVASEISDDERVKRYPVYEQLGDPKVMVIGRVGHQKRVRKLLRLMPSSSPVHVAVWEECYFRWCMMNELTVRMSIPTTADGFDTGSAPVGDKVMSAEERQAQWQNLTLFLASFGSACVRESEDLSTLKLNIAPYYLADQMRVLRNPTELMSSFLHELIDLLLADSINVRDTAKDALGNEASPRLYTKIFKSLDNVVRQLAEGNSIDWDNLAIFVDQFLSVLKVYVENSQCLEELRSFDLCSTLAVIAGFIGRYHDVVSYRLRLKFCNLCEGVFDQAENITMRKDNSDRQKIADIIIEWTQDVSACERDIASIQRDINNAVFRAAVKLFDRLQLQVPDGASGEEAAHAISRLFVRYSSFLFKAWEHIRCEPPLPDDSSADKLSIPGLRMLQRDGESRELVITGLVSLVSANPEVGVKNCLPLAYEEDPVKRIIFAYVFARVLPQGIALSTVEPQPNVQRQSRLCELVKGPDLSLAIAACEVCPASEVDNLISVMLNLFDTRSSLMTLLKNMIEIEVGRTENDTALFRGNSTCTRFLSAFANIYGYNYLRSLVIPLIKTMTSMPAGHGYDLDPAKVGEQAARRNQANIQLITSSFLEIILSSVPVVPPMLREICAHIAKVVNQVWPEAKFAAVGAFMFLRFISPAIVAPETIDIEVPKDDITIRRGLMLVAKIIQNLANNIFFGKEAHMTPLNDFLKANIVNVTRFLSELNKYVPSGPEDEPEEWLNTTYDDTDTIVLHRFFEKYADKIGKELLTVSKPPVEKLTPQAEAHVANGKRVWDALCASLVELGQPLEAARITTASSQEHREYLDLMERFKHRDTTPVQGLFVEALCPTPQERAIFVLSVSRVDVEVLDIELLLYYMFKVLTSPSNESHQFDIILDLTSFIVSSQLPMQWLKFTFEVIPSDIRGRIRTAHLVTPNALALRYMRRLYNLSTGIHLAADYKTYASVDELLRCLPEGIRLPSLDYAIQMEEEQRMHFGDVTMRHAHPMRVPVSLEIAQSHLRITTMKAQTIGGSLTCKATEIVPLSEVNDVYNVSTGHDNNEFIIRKIRQGVTMYFSSTARDAIVKAIRAAKNSLRTIQLPGTERLSRFSNVVATLLHVGMIGINSTDEEVRIAGNELLQAVCTYLDFEGKPIITSKINGFPGPLLVLLSESLANFAPHLTLDFITEVSQVMSKESVPDRIMSLHYLAPWVKNLACFANPASKYYEPSASKFRDCVRVLVDLTMSDDELHFLTQKYIWAEVGKLDSNVVNAVLDELMRAAVDGGEGSLRCERVADTMGAISSINVRGRILSRLRKVIGKTSTKPTKSLADNVHWNEVSCLLRLALVAGHHCKNAVQSQLFVPETVHLVILTAGIGQASVRTSVYGLVVNLLNTLYTARIIDSTASPEIQLLLSECEQRDTLRLFGLSRPTPTSEYINVDPANDKSYIDTLESLVQFLGRVLETIAGTKGLLNVWRARWMSLITSSAFQLSPAVQTRAFVALGILATSDVDDDLLYQMLVAFKTALSQSSENDTTSVVSMLRCIRNVIPALPRSSRYVCQLFWLAVALLQSSHMGLYVEAIHLLRVTLEVMDNQRAFQQNGVAATLLEGRSPFEDVACQLDQLLGISFEASFSFSLASIIFKGLRHASLQEPAEAALRSLLSITVRSCGEIEHADDGPGGPICQEILGYFLALLPLSATVKSFRRLLEDIGVHQSWFEQDFLSKGDDDDAIRGLPFALFGLADDTSALFVTSFVGAMLGTAQSDDFESQILYTLLADIADTFPNIICITYESLQDKIKDAFGNSSSPVILNAVANIFRIATQDTDRLAAARGSASTLSVDEGVSHGPGRSHLHALEDQGMKGLANNFQFLPPNRGHATKMMNWISELVMKIIE